MNQKEGKLGQDAAADGQRTGLLWTDYGGKGSLFCCLIGLIWVLDYYICL